MLFFEPNIINLSSIQVYTEIDFVKNPTPEIEGSVDRWLFHSYVEKYMQYYLALRHVFNTGQGTYDIFEKKHVKSPNVFHTALTFLLTIQDA